MDMNLFRKSQTQTPDKDILSGVCVWDLIPYLEPAGNYNGFVTGTVITATNTIP